MERAIRENSFVLIVCTPMYKEKSAARQGGVGYEGDIMTAEVFTTGNQRKFIPILRKGDLETSIPTWLAGKYRVDLRGEPYSQDQYDDLLTTIHGLRPKAPPIGPIPERLSRTESVEQRDIVATFDPIKIKGVLVDEVTTPRNDGTRGSALYAIPFQLSRQPSAEWAKIFVETWNHPPSFSTMHRPGIAQVTGDRVILNGTTIEEVERHHRETLKLVVDSVNIQIANYEHIKQQREEQERQRLQSHNSNVRDIAKRLSFDD